MVKLFGWLKRLAESDAAASAPEPGGPSLVELSSMVGAFQTVEGIEHPDWDVIGRQIVALVPEHERDRAYREVCAQWLGKLAIALGERYRVYSTKEVALLTGADAEDAADLVRLATVSVRTLRDMFARLPLRPAYGCFAIVQFSDVGQYYSYLCGFHPDGEWPASGGVYLNRGYGHVALPPQPGPSIPGAVVHEFTHSLLDLLPHRIPLWLNEGLAQVMPATILRERPTLLNRERLARHQEYWGRHGLEGVWSGAVWNSTDDGLELAYEIAETLVRNMLIDHPKRVVEFIGKAKWNDAGEGAAVECLGESLAERATQFLGPGEWKPRSGYDQGDDGDVSRSAPQPGTGTPRLA